MPDLLDRFRDLDRLEMPVEWGDVQRREPRPPIDAGPSPLRRAGIAVLALVVAAVGFAFASKVFRNSPQHGKPAISLTPTVVISPEVVSARILATTNVSDYPNAATVGAGAVWVSARNESNAGDVVRVNAETGDIVARVPVDALPGWEVGGGGMAFGLGSVWVTGEAKAKDPSTAGCCDAIVTQIDPATNRVTDVIDVGAGIGADVWADATGIWVLNIPAGKWNSLEVARVDPATHRVVDTISVPGIWSQEIFGSGGSIWVKAHFPDPSCPGSCVGDGSLFRIDPGTHEVSAVEATGLPQEPSANDTTSIWARTDDGVQRIDPSTGAFAGDPISQVIEADCCGAILSDGEGGVWIVDASGKDRGIWHANADGSLVGFADIETSELADALSGTAYAFDPATQTIWIVNYRNSVSAVELR